LRMAGNRCVREGFVDRTYTASLTRADTAEIS